LSPAIRLHTISTLSELFRRDLLTFRKVVIAKQVPVLQASSGPLLSLLSYSTEELSMNTRQVISTVAAAAIALLGAQSHATSTNAHVQRQHHPDCRLYGRRTQPQ
jgi:hypothetical protein